MGFLLLAATRCFLNEHRKENIPMKLVTMFVLVLAVAGTAYGDIIFQIGNVPQTDENILFNQTGLISTGNPVTGITNQTGRIFAFGSNETLTTPSAGQARIEAVNNPFNLLTITGLTNTIFESAIFNLNAASSGLVTISVTNTFGQTETQTFNVDPAGENFFTLTTDLVQSIQSISISGANLNDVRQIRIGGAGPSQTVPEPSTMLLLGTGLLALGLVSRSRRVKSV
jgi:hypothetical protein